MSIKVFVVTTGTYSDYGIEKVFVDENNAKQYVEKYNKTNSYDEARIEEYWSFDGYLAENYNYVQVEAYKELGKDIINYNFNFGVGITETDESENHTSFQVFRGNEYSQNYFNNPHSKIYLERKIQDDYDEEKIKAKYGKVIQDMMFMIESNHEELLASKYGSDLHKDFTDKLNDI